MSVYDSNLRNAWEMTFLFMLNGHIMITLVMTKELTLSIRQSRFHFLDVLSFVLLFSGNENKPLYLSRLQEKAQLKKILLTHMVTSMVMVKGF